MADRLRLGFVPKRHRLALALVDRASRRRENGWVSSRDPGGVHGTTQTALATIGVAETRWVDKPYPHQVARPTDLGRRYLAEHADHVRELLREHDVARGATFRPSDLDTFELHDAILAEPDPVRLAALNDELRRRLDVAGTGDAVEAK